MPLVLRVPFVVREFSADMTRYVEQVLTTWVSGAVLSSHIDVDRVFVNMDVLSQAQNSRGKSHALIR